MAERLRWWVIPGALIVLAHVVSLDSGGPPAPGGDARGPAVALPPVVAVREASGSRSRPLALAATATRAFVVHLPGHEGQRGEMTIWRRLDAGREATPWLTLRPKVRGDGSIPIAGLPAGRYDVEMVFGDGAAAERLAATAVDAPGSVEFAAATPLR
ncbi:MAG: hypothetical protein JNN13_07230 [Planctomycetes bacterium]|nr:hypothetical protein [Planctomycetota bacterium]